MNKNELELFFNNNNINLGKNVLDSYLDSYNSLNKLTSNNLTSIFESELNPEIISTFKNFLDISSIILKKIDSNLLEEFINLILKLADTTSNKLFFDFYFETLKNLKQNYIEMSFINKTKPEDVLSALQFILNDFVLEIDTQSLDNIKFSTEEMDSFDTLLNIFIDAILVKKDTLTTLTESMSFNFDLNEDFCKTLYKLIIDNKKDLLDFVILDRITSLEKSISLLDND